MLFKIIKTSLLISILSYVTAVSQSGANYSEFAEKLKPYFDDALISDLKSNLPNQSEFLVWSWDIGDYSGDGFTDLAFSITRRGRKGKQVEVYLFADVEGYLVEVGKFTKKYVELPLEVGVAIRNNTCFISEKYKQFHWSIQGYRFDNGFFHQVDEFFTEKVEKLSQEDYLSFSNLIASKKLIDPVNGKISSSIMYSQIPSYYRTQRVYKGFGKNMNISNIEFVPQGAFYFDGDSDLTFSIDAVYDDDYFYFMINTKDDIVVTQDCDTCLGESIEAYFCVQNISEKNFKTALEKKSNYDEAEYPIIKIKFNLGNFADIKPTYLTTAPADLVDDMKLLSPSIRVVSSPTDSGYYFKFKVPRELLINDFTIIEKDDPLIFPIAFNVIDYDNKYRPNERTEMANCSLIPNDIRTFSIMRVIPRNNYFGQSNNIYKDKINQYLLEYGF